MTVWSYFATLGEQKCRHLICEHVLSSTNLNMFICGPQVKSMCELLFLTFGTEIVGYCLATYIGGGKS